MTMIAALKLDDLVPSRDPTSQTDSTHRRFSPRVHHTHTLHRGEELRAYQLSHLNLSGITRPIACPLTKLLLDSGLDLGVGMS